MVVLSSQPLSWQKGHSMTTVHKSAQGSSGSASRAHGGESVSDEGASVTMTAGHSAEALPPAPGLLTPEVSSFIQCRRDHTVRFTFPLRQSC